MANKITRTITQHEVLIVDVKSGEVLESFKTSSTPDKKKIAVARIKAGHDTGFEVVIKSNTETREMSIETFMSYSQIVDGKSIVENNGGEN